MRGQAIRRLRRRQRKVLVAIVGVALVASIPAALAGKGGGGKVSATIDMMSSVSVSSTSASTGEAWFEVTRSRYDYKEIMYVVNTCYDESGDVVTINRKPVLWGEWNSYDGVAGSYETGGVVCRAYVTLRPWTGKALGDAVMTYTP